MELDETHCDDFEIELDILRKNIVIAINCNNIKFACEAQLKVVSRLNALEEIEVEFLDLNFFNHWAIIFYLKYNLNIVDVPIFELKKEFEKKLHKHFEAMCSEDLLKIIDGDNADISHAHFSLELDYNNL